jgi:hypothetical protein
MLGAMLRLGKCLAVTLSQEEKQELILYDMQVDIRSPEAMRDFFEASERALQGLRLHAKNNCPQTGIVFGQLLQIAPAGADVALELALQDVVETILAAQVLADEVRYERFIGDYTPIGLEDSPF